MEDNFNSGRDRLKNAVRRSHRKRYWRNHDKSAYTCPSCPYDGEYYEVHHIDGDCLNGHPLNLVGLCHRCHRAVHRLHSTAEQVGAWKARIDTL